MKYRFLNYLLAGLMLIALLAAGACNEDDVTTPPPGPAEFEVTSLEIAPSEEVTPGETVTITAIVENTGGSEGTYTAVLTVDGINVETKAVVIAAGAAKTVTFSLVKYAGIYEIGVGGLRLSFVVAWPVIGVTPDSEGVVSDQEGGIPFGFVDIVSVKVTVEGEEMVVQIKLSELPEALMFNQAPEGTIEYEWIIFFDVDGNPDTGTAVAEQVGAEYALAISHWASGEAKEASILDGCRKDFWKDEGGSMKRQPEGTTAETDYATNTLTLGGKIPGLNSESRWFVMSYYRDAAAQMSWTDQTPDIGFALLPENSENGEDS